MVVLRFILINICASATVSGAALTASAPAHALSTMASVDYSKVPFQEKPLHTPPLEEIAEVLSRGLKAYFAEVEVTAAECPDLTKSPFNLTSPVSAVDRSRRILYVRVSTSVTVYGEAVELSGRGRHYQQQKYKPVQREANLSKSSATPSVRECSAKRLSGDEKLVEVGGVPYLVPLVKREKIYDLALLARHLRRDPAFLCGAGAGPWPHRGVNCEGMINLSVRNGSVEQGTRIAYVTPAGGCALQRLPPADTRTALLGNYLLSDGSPGTVLKVVAKNRISDTNYITAIRETLKNHYGEKVVGLGGTFLLRAGRVKHHVMPDFSATPLLSDADVEAWLRFFEMSAPLTHVGTLVTGDLGLDLRVQHFHGWGEHGDGGHYHCDTTPRDAHYEGYFAVARGVLRLDAPPDTHGFGRD